MMKFRFLFPIVTAAALLCACVNEEMLQEEVLETPSGEYSSALFETGHVRIYVDPATAERLESSSAQESVIPTKAARILGQVRMERTFPYAGKFEKRTREAGLDRWYDVWFDESTPLTKAALSLEDIPGVIEVEYRPITKRPTMKPFSTLRPHRLQSLPTSLSTTLHLRSNGTCTMTAGPPARKQDAT